MREPFDLEIKGSYTETSKDLQSGTVYGPVRYNSVSRRAAESYSGTHRRKPEGNLKLLPTGYQFSRTREDYPRGTCSVKQTHRPTGIPTSLVTYDGVGMNVIPNLNDAIFSMSHALDANARNRAIIKARLAFKRQDINLGVAFGEHAETAKLVGDTTVRLAKSLTHLKRGIRHGNMSEVRKAMSTLGISKKQVLPSRTSAHRAWLELQYGWKPLLQDVHGAVSALSARPPSAWLTEGKGTVYTRIKTGEKFFLNPSSSVIGSQYGHCDGFDIVQCKIYAEPTNDLLQTFVSIGLTNPFEVAWELVPFSFVVDWFVPVGDFLSSIDALLGFQAKAAYVTTFRKAKWTRKGMGGKDSDYFYLYESEADWSATKEEIFLVREVFSEAPWPTFPPVKDGRSLGHMANGLSLLAAVFGGKDTRRKIHL